MILSASRRTDIPAFYADWFLNRLREGSVLVRNPMNYHQVSEVKLTPENVDCIVFWTKNPSRLLEKLPEIDNLGYRYYFQFTLNPYDRSIEENLPEKNVLVETFKRLSDQCGPQKVIWRYDPIFVGGDYPVQYHAEQFDHLARQLNGYTEKCIFSFLDPYAKIQKAIRQLGIRRRNRLGELRNLARSMHRRRFNRKNHRLPAQCWKRPLAALDLRMRFKHRHRFIQYLHAWMQILLRQLWKAGCFQKSSLPQSQFSSHLWRTRRTRCRETKKREGC